MTIVIKDDGIGFNIDNKEENTFGLVGMEEKVDMLHRKLNIRSKPKEGTSIFITIPISYD